MDDDPDPAPRPTPNAPTTFQATALSVAHAVNTQSPDTAADRAVMEALAAARNADSPHLDRWHERKKLFQHAFTAGFVAMVVNLLIAALKLSVHFTISPSATLFSEGLHSLGDGVNSLVLLYGVLQGSKRPDRNHPFGYGLEANLWALIASFLLLLSSVWALYEGVLLFLNPHPPMQSYTIAIYVLMASVVFEIGAVWVASRAVLNELNIPQHWLLTIPRAMANVKQVQVPTTRYVFFEDLMALAGAFIALSILVGTQWSMANGLLSPQYAHIPDAVGSLLIGTLLMALAINLFRHNKHVLMGAAASQTDEAAISALILSTHGVSEIVTLRTIDQGHMGLMVQLTVKVDPDTPVKDVDDITERIKFRLSDQVKAIHAEQVIVEVLADEKEEDWSEQFDVLVGLGAKQGVLKPRDAALLRRAFDFSSLEIRDVMIPRTDVCVVDMDATLAQVARQMVDTGHSRLPVIGQSVDDLLGLIHNRDVFQALHENRDVPLLDLVRTVSIYPETKPLSDLLEEFKRKKLRFAAVADEHGGFAGIVTAEDLMEEIVGDIWDEHEEIEHDYTIVSPQRVLVSGRSNIEDLNDSLDLGLPDDDYVTLGGYVFGSLGREPLKGDQVAFEGFTFTVEETEGPRIVTVAIDAPTPFPFARDALDAVPPDIRDNGE